MYFMKTSEYFFINAFLIGQQIIIIIYNYIDFFRLVYFYRINLGSWMVNTRSLIVINYMFTSRGMSFFREVLTIYDKCC